MGYPNYLDSDFYPVVLTGGDWSLPLENLKNERLSLFAKTNGLNTSDSWFECDLGVSRNISLSAIPNGNFTIDAKKRLRLSNTPSFGSCVVSVNGSINDNSISFQNTTSSSITVSSGDFFTINDNLYKSDTTLTINPSSTGIINLASASGNDIHNSLLVESISVNDVITCNTGDYSTPLYDSGLVDIFNILYPYGSLSWTHPSFWTGKLLEEDRTGLIFPIIDLLTNNPIICRYARYDFDDSTNSDTGIAINRSFFTPGYQPTINPIYGANIQYNTDTTFEKSFGGEKSYERKDPYRSFAFSIENLPQNEALTQGLDIQRIQGMDKQMFFIMNPDDLENLHRTSFVATLRSLDPLTYSYFDHMSFNLILEEVIGGVL